MSDTPDLASAAKSAADFLDSYTDESELARRSPLLVEIMRAHAAEVRSALAAHDQQGDPDDDEPEQVQLAMVPLPGNGRYSVTVEHQADRGEDHYQTQEWEVWAKDGNVRVEPMTYPEPGVSDTPEPPPEPCNNRGPRNHSAPVTEKPLHGVRLMQESIAQNEAAHRGQPTDDELLARADRHAEVIRTYGIREYADGELIRDLAAALRHHVLVSDALKATRRELAEAREALRFIDRHGCTNYTRGRCLDESSRSKDAKYSAEAWCDACVAAEALWASQEGTSDG